MSLPESTLSQVPVAPVARGPQRRMVRRRFWVLLFATMLLCLPCYPPAWHGALRAWLTWQARGEGCVLSIGSIDGGLFDTTRLQGLRCRRDDGSELAIDRAELTLSWTIPFFQQATPTLVRNVVLEGVRGRWELRGVGPAGESFARLTHGGGFPLADIAGSGFARGLGSLLPAPAQDPARFVPENFLIRADDLLVTRGRYQLRAVRLWVSGARDDAGQFFARELHIAGPGFENTLLSPHSQTYWKDRRLTLAGLELAPGMTLTRATLDGAHLDRGELDWEGKLAALGGEVQGQGAVDFSGERIALEVAATLRGTALRPLVRLLGLAGPTDGLIEQGNFTFRGDPEHWPDAEMWLAAHATDFRWGKRRWQDLALQAVVVNRRVQVNRLELQQRRNRVSLRGECSLPPPGPAEDRAADTLREWRAGGFSCEVDARLDDLHALAELFGPQAPELAGRMSVNGSLTAPPGTAQTVNGYLNVEGSGLVLRGAPLDFLKSTLLFRDGELRVADLQATHGGDYFTGTGSMRLDGPPRYEGELRAEVRNLGDYTPALAGLPLADELARVGGLSAQWRWDDSVLHFDECRGLLGGAPCTVGGTVDLHDAAHPALDLSFDAENVTLRDASGQQQAQADCVLTLRAAAGQTPTLAGDVRLLGGATGFQADLLPVADASVPEIAPRPGTFLPCDDWLPTGGKDWGLDLSITTADGVPAVEPGREIVAPNLRLVRIGPGAPPKISGRIELRHVFLSRANTLDGTLYFLGEPGETPVLTAVTTATDPLSKLWQKSWSNATQRWVDPGEKIWYTGPVTRLERSSANRLAPDVFFIGERAADPAADSSLGAAARPAHPTPAYVLTLH